jgi:AraC-like DNA-binding protein
MPTRPTRVIGSLGGPAAPERPHLSRRFQRETGMTLRAWRQRLRLFKAVELLAGGQDVTQVALALGYASPSAFTAMFHQAMGQRPSAYRQTVGAASGG